MEKKMNNKNVRRILAYLLAVCICIGGIPIAYALGDEHSAENKTLLTYNDSGTEVDVFEPSEEFNEAWSIGLEKAADRLASEGYENLEAANEKDVMIYVSKEDVSNNEGVLKTDLEDIISMEKQGLEKYDGKGGTYFVWRLYKTINIIDSTNLEENQNTEEILENVKKETIHYLWIRTDIPITLEVSKVVSLDSIEENEKVTEKFKEVNVLENTEEENTEEQNTEVVTEENDTEAIIEENVELNTTDKSITNDVLNEMKKTDNNLGDAATRDNINPPVRIEPGIFGNAISGDSSSYNNWNEALKALVGVKAPDTVFRITFTINSGEVDLNSITKENCAGLIFTGDVNETETQTNSAQGGGFSLSSDGYGHNTDLIDDKADPSLNQYKKNPPEGVPTLTTKNMHLYEVKIPYTIRNIKLVRNGEINGGSGNRIQIGPGVQCDAGKQNIYGIDYNRKMNTDNTSVTIYTGKWQWAGTKSYNQTVVNKQLLRVYGGSYDYLHGSAEGSTSQLVDISIDVKEGYGEFACVYLQPLRNSNSNADKVNVEVYADPGVIGKINNYYSYTSATGLVPEGYKTVIDAPDFTFGNVSAGNAYVVNGTYTMPCELIINNVKKIGNICGVGVGDNSAESIVGRKSTTAYYPYKEDDDNYGIVIKINCDLETNWLVFYTKLIIGNGATVNKKGDNALNANDLNDSVNENGVLYTTDLSGDVDIIEGGSLNVMGYQHSYGLRNVGSSDNTGILRVNPLAYSGIYLKGDYLGGLTLDVVDEAVSGLRKGQKITRFLTSSYADVKRFQEKGMKLGPNLRKNNYGIAVTKSGTDGYYVLGDKMDYQVSYSANGATGSIPLANSYEEGKEVTVVDAAAMVPPADKAFDYWESSAAVTVNGTSTTKLNPNDTFVMPAQDITLKAIWKDAKTDITFDGFEDGNDALLKIKNEAGKVNSKALPKIKINGADAALEDLEKMTYTYERYTRTGSSGNYTYGWSGKVLQEGINDADIEKLPVSITKPAADNLTISANTKKSMSGIVKLTISYNGDENSQASCIIISSGDVDLNGNIRASDIVMLEAYISGDPGVKLDQYAYQKIMGDMNSEATTGTIRITPQDVELLEAIIVN